jgi:hypothetical protein
MSEVIRGTKGGNTQEKNMASSTLLVVQGAQRVGQGGLLQSRGSGPKLDAVMTL